MLMLRPATPSNVYVWDPPCREAYTPHDLSMISPKVAFPEGNTGTWKGIILMYSLHLLIYVLFGNVGGSVDEASSSKVHVKHSLDDGTVNGGQAVSNEKAVPHAFHNVTAAQYPYVAPVATSNGEPSCGTTPPHKTQRAPHPRYVVPRFNIY